MGKNKTIRKQKNIKKALKEQSKIFEAMFFAQAKYYNLIIETMKFVMAAGKFEKGSNTITNELNNSIHIEPDELIVHPNFAEISEEKGLNVNIDARALPEDISEKIEEAIKRSFNNEHKS